MKLHNSKVIFLCFETASTGFKYFAFFNFRKAKEITLGKLHETYTKVCKKRNMKPYDIGQALTSCESLESKSILRVKNGGKAAKDKKLDLRIGEFLLC